MDALKLYRLLLAHVSAVNALVVALYGEKITADEARTQALAELENTLQELKG